MNSHKPKVLHVDDNPRVLSFVGPELTAAGFQYVGAANGFEALATFESQKPDIVVLDVNLDDAYLNGLDVCKKIREQGHRVPVIFLTVRDRTEDATTMRRAFSVGGNDYIAKREELRRIEQRMGMIPTEFIERKSDVDELILRIRAHLTGHLPAGEFNDLLRVDFEHENVQVKRDGTWRGARITSSQFDILKTLVVNGGKGVTKSDLLVAAGSNRLDTNADRVLQSHIYKIREAIEPNPREPIFILTYHRIGYRFGGKSSSE